MSFVKRFFRKDNDNPYSALGLPGKSRDDFLMPYTTWKKSSSDYLMNAAPEYLLYVATHDPVMFRITYHCAQDAINPWFTLIDFDNKPIKQNREVQEKLQSLHAKPITRLLATWELIFGRAWITRKTPNEIYAISPLDLLDPKAECFNDEGKEISIPVTYRFRQVSGTYSSVDVSPDDYIFFRSRPLGLSSYGVSIVEVCREDGNHLYNLRRDMAERIRKYAGFPHAQVQGASDTLLKAYKSRYGDLNRLDELWSNDKLKLEMKGLEGATLNPDYYYKPFIEQISIATGIPLSILRGMESGQLKSGQINLSSYYAVVTNIQASIEPIMESLIEWYFPGLMEKSAIRWNIEFAYSDADRAAINEIKVRNAVELRPYITDDAFARLLLDIGITKKDIESDWREKQNPFMGMDMGQGGEDEGNDKGEKKKSPDSPFFDRMNPISEQKGREFGEKKDKTVRSNT